MLILLHTEPSDRFVLLSAVHILLHINLIRLIYSNSIRRKLVRGTTNTKFQNKNRGKTQWAAWCQKKKNIVRTWKLLSYSYCQQNPSKLCHPMQRLANAANTCMRFWSLFVNDHLLNLWVHPNISVSDEKIFYLVLEIF